MIKNSFLLFLLLLMVFPATAQNSNKVFHFLELPVSARAAALGGENISIVEDDLTMAVHNPALLSYVSNKSLNLNYMSYIEGAKVGSAAYSRLLGTRSAWAVTAQYMDYGKMYETNDESTILGEFSAKDIAIAGIYSYDLSDYWSGGVKINLIYADYHEYNSFAIGSDLGLNYLNEDKGFSFSMVVRNLGGQIKTFEDKNESLPVNVQVGVSQAFAHAPFRISLTLNKLNDWDGAVNKKLANHVIIGADFLPTNNLYVSLGYNFGRADEMKIKDSAHGAGFSVGAGIQVKRFKLGMAYAKYHTSASSLLFNLAMVL
ncbi:DUF3308 domain-containing protein [Bacteroides sp. 214]|uniref:type IX secretion system protein PorQ n=1 Tax=Bacteroides sp. 214 TaxID=2302935 RepID=UPI0013D0FE4A|nr:type IX secretion system protein PorQ [Bacteroides sp. 214]NDW13409.1 DUF3308 domain-containing protein [Bacteroides sp. 214]